VITNKVSNVKDIEIHSETHKPNKDDRDAIPDWKIFLYIMVDSVEQFAYGLKIKIVSQTGSVTDFVSIVQFLNVPQQ